jgi:hypothetical protein
MILLKNINSRHRNLITRFLVLILAVFLPGNLVAQEMPPRPVSVYLVRSLSFGAFAPGNLGGTITISPDGARSSSGEIYFFNLGFVYYEAVFEIEGNAGTLISVLKGDDVTLTGSSGGTMTMHLGDSYPSSPIILNTNAPDRTQYHLGGVLNVGNLLANPPGQYNGVFYVTFIQE